MSAHRDVLIDCVSGIIRIGAVADAPAAPRPHPLARALGPALETAYGIEHASSWPNEILALIARLQAAQPDGPRSFHHADSALEPV